MVVVVVDAAATVVSDDKMKKTATNISLKRKIRWLELCLLSSFPVKKSAFEIHFKSNASACECVLSFILSVSVSVSVCVCDWNDCGEDYRLLVALKTVNNGQQATRGSTGSREA